MKKTIKRSFEIFLIIAFFIGCEGFTEIDPPDTFVVSSELFANDRLARSAVEGIYHQMFNDGNFASGGQQSVTVLAGLSSDELLAGPFHREMVEFQDNDINPSSQLNLQLWTSAYSTIYMANAVLEGLGSSDGISVGVRGQLMGEAYFVRAFTYFYLTHLYGEVPLITGTDHTENLLADRRPISEVLQLMIADLEQASQLSGDTYREGERTHPNRYAALALLSRIHLFLGDWATAERLAGEVIGSGQYALEANLDQVFLANGSEAIWQLMPTISGNTNEGNLFILLEPPVSSFFYPVYLNDGLVDSFDSEDLRLASWVGDFQDGESTYHYPFKYKVRLSTSSPTEHSTVLRLSEQYLIRSEARIRQGKFQQGLEDLNTVRNRAGLGDTPMGTETELLEALLEERKKELFTEWGHRWLDLKRLDRAPDVLGLQKPDWQDTDALYPIPEQELDRAPNLEQNPGY